jgi:hypothetical protein
MRLFLIGILLSFNLFAGEWADLEEGTAYKLTQNFQLPQAGERSGSILDFSKGDSFTLKEIMPLPIGFPLTAFIFKHNNCPGPQIKADVELVTVESTGVVVGAALEECELSVYVEGKDYYSTSLFE